MNVREWQNRVVGPVRAAGVWWTLAGLVLVQALMELALVPAVAGGGLPAVAQIIVVLLTGIVARLALGAFVAARLLRAGVDHADDIVRAVVVGVLIGLALTWIAGWLAIRPLWDPGAYAAELGRFLVAVVLWVLPCGWGARWLARTDASLRAR